MTTRCTDAITRFKGAMEGSKANCSVYALARSATVQGTTGEQE